MARTCSSTRARSTAAGSAWAPSADTARPPRTVSRSSSRRSEGSSSTATSNNSEPIRGSPSTDPKGASSKPGSPGTHPTGAQVSTSSRSVNTPIAPGSHTHPTQSSPTPRTTPGLPRVSPPTPLAEIGRVPARDRSGSAPRSVRGTRRAPASPQGDAPTRSRHHTPLRPHRRTATSRRFSSSAAAPAAVKAHEWSLLGHEQPHSRTLPGLDGSDEPVPGSRSPARSGQGPTAMKGPGGGTSLVITDPHE